MPNKKHAYLILCHNHFGQLKSLLELLDDERNDIYVHVDKKSGACPESGLRNAVKKSGLFFTERIEANWGGYSLVKAELILLEQSAKRGYAYYHLLSGADLPLKPQDEIRRFFDENAGKEFIHYGNEDKRKKALIRAAHYYPFQEARGRGFRNAPDWRRRLFRLPLLCLAKFTDIAQSLLLIDRLGKNRELIFYGSQWFSVTHDFVSYVLTQTAFIEEYFQYSLCPDELFIQTLAMSSPFRERIVRDNLRLIDWKRGGPYVFQSEDYDLLMSSGRLFARKFDEEKDPEIIGRISRAVLSEASGGQPDILRT